MGNVRDYISREDLEKAEKYFFQLIKLPDFDSIFEFENTNSMSDIQYSNYIDSMALSVQTYYFDKKLNEKDQEAFNKFFLTDAEAKKFIPTPFYIKWKKSVKVPNEQEQVNLALEKLKKIAQQAEDSKDEIKSPVLAHIEKYNWTPDDLVYIKTLTRCLLKPTRKNFELLIYFHNAIFADTDPSFSALLRDLKKKAPSSKQTPDDTTFDSPLEQLHTLASDMEDSIDPFERGLATVALELHRLLNFFSEEDSSMRQHSTNESISLNKEINDVAIEAVKFLQEPTEKQNQLLRKTLSNLLHKCNSDLKIEKQPLILESRWFVWLKSRNNKKSEALRMLQEHPEDDKKPLYVKFITAVQLRSKSLDGESIFLREFENIVEDKTTRIEEKIFKLSLLDLEYVSKEGYIGFQVPVKKFFLEIKEQKMSDNLSKLTELVTMTTDYVDSSTLQNKLKLTSLLDNFPEYRSLITEILKVPIRSIQEAEKKHALHNLKTKAEKASSSQISSISLLGKDVIQWMNGDHSMTSIDLITALTTFLDKPTSSHFEKMKGFFSDEDRGLKEVCESLSRETDLVGLKRLLLETEESKDDDNLKRALKRGAKTLYTELKNDSQYDEKNLAEIAEVAIDCLLEPSAVNQKKFDEIRKNFGKSFFDSVNIARLAKARLQKFNSLVPDLLEREADQKAFIERFKNSFNLRLEMLEQTFTEEQFEDLALLFSSKPAKTFEATMLRLETLDLDYIIANESKKEDLNSVLIQSAQEFSRELKKVNFNLQKPTDLNKIKDLVEATTECIKNPIPENFTKHEGALERAESINLFGVKIIPNSKAKLLARALGFLLAGIGLVLLLSSVGLLLYTAFVSTPISILGITLSVKLLWIGVVVSLGLGLSGGAMIKLIKKEKVIPITYETSRLFGPAETFQQKKPKPPDGPLKP